MDWKDLRGDIGKVAPILGTLIGGPAGGAVGAMIASAIGTGNTPDEVAQALATSPEAAVKIKQIEADRQVQLQSLIERHAEAEITAQSNVVQSVNATMQTEGKSDHWPTYAWRPYNGFIFGTMAFGCYFVLPLMHIAPPSVPPEVWLAFGGVLGVASWFRGKAQADPNVQIDTRG
jgi:hypothetical protein